MIPFNLYSAPIASVVVAVAVAVAVDVAVAVAVAAQQWEREER